MIRDKKTGKFVRRLKSQHRDHSFTIMILVVAVILGMFTVSVQSIRLNNITGKYEQLSTFAEGLAELNTKVQNMR
jgi:hypothetical protein